MDFFPIFDTATSFSPKYKTSCLLGVVQTHLLNIFEGDEPFYIGPETEHYLRKLPSRNMNVRKVSSHGLQPPGDMSRLDDWTG